MAIFDLFSKRQKVLRGDVPDVFYYDDIPNPLRVQIVHIIRDAIGETKGHHSQDKPREAYKFIHDSLCREYGLFTLSNSSYNESDESSVLNYFLQTKDYERAIDIIEFFFKYIDLFIKVNLSDYSYYTTIKIKPDDAISELNDRFKEHGVGYQYQEGQIMRVDSTYIHSEVVIPTLILLRNKNFKGANEEFLKAHEHYRLGQNKECLSECLKAFESTMKIICKEKGWAFSPSDTSKKLISICLQNNLIPSFTQNQYTSLSNLLESGIPTIRNKLSGHGQEQVPQKVDDEMTRYGLNLTVTNILFLIEQSGL
jgi:hypothetical protein